MKERHYAEHLISRLKDHCKSELMQKGKSDIEPINYDVQINEWYKQIFDWVEDNPPTNYVRSIEVFQDQFQIIKDIKYNYCENEDSSILISINIFWI